jgi:hypothetical protein
MDILVTLRSGGFMTPTTHSFCPRHLRIQTSAQMMVVVPSARMAYCAFYRARAPVGGSTRRTKKATEPRGPSWVAATTPPPKFLDSRDPILVPVWHPSRTQPARTPLKKTFLERQCLPDSIRNRLVCFTVLISSLANFTRVRDRVPAFADETRPLATATVAGYCWTA